MGADREEPASHLAPLFPRQHLRMLHEGGREPSSVVNAGAVLFVDVSGFTALTEAFSRQGSRGAEELSNLLKALWAVVLPAIAGQGGDVLSFAGDAVWAWWPEDHTHGLRKAALLASRAGLVAARGVSALGDRSEAQIRIRGGVGLGEIRFLHLILPSSRSLFVASGSSILDAGGALASAAEGDLVVSPAAASLVADQNQGRALPGGGWLVQSMSTVLVEPPAPPAVPIAQEAVSHIRGAVPPPVLQRLEAGLGHWLAEFRYASVIFVGLPTVDLDAPLPRLRGLCERIEETALAFEGFVYQMLRDEKGLAAVLLFGLPPHAHENDSERAVRAGLKLGERLQECGGTPIVAVASGLVFCDLAGIGTRKTYMVAGPAMNLAARLMQMSGGRVLCDETTARAIRAPDLRFEPLDLQVRGKSIPSTVYQAAAVAPRWQPVGRTSPPPALANRTEEQRRLIEGLETTRSGSPPPALMLEGDAGVGKTALVEVVRARSEQWGLPCFLGAADSLSPSIPYAPLHTLLRPVLGLDGAQGSEARQRVLHALSAMPQQLPLAPLLNPILGLELSETEVTRRLNEEGRAQATRNLLQRCLELTTPAVLIIEDVQWLDPSTWSLLAHLVRDEAKVWILLTARPLEAPRVWQDLLGEGRVQTLGIGALGAEATALVAGSQLGVQRLPEKALPFLAARSGGNPRFVLEIASTLVDIGLLRVEGGDAWLVPTVTDLERQFDDALANRGVSSTLQGLINSRFDRMSPAEQMVMKIASVIGQGFSFDLLGDLAAVSGVQGDLSSVVLRLCQARFLRKVAERPVAVYEADHAVVADSVYSTIPFQQRRVLHRAVAEWYEQAPAADGSHMVRAHHWARAEDRRALAHFDVAGERSLAAHANEEAVKAFSAALEVDGALPTDEQEQTDTERVRRHLRLGRAFVNLSNYSAAVEHLQTGLRLSGRSVPEGTLRLVLGTVLGVFRQFFHYRFNRFFLGRRGSRREQLLDEAHAYEGLTESYFNLGNNLACLHYALLSLNVAELAGPSPATARGYASLGAIVGFVPLVSVARAYCARAKRVADTIDDPSAQAWVAVATGVLEAGLGNWEVANALFLQTADLGRSLGDGRRCDDAAQNLAAVAFWQGRFAESMAWTDSLVESGRRRSDTFMHADGLRRRAHWLLMSNRLAEAANAIEALADLRASKRNEPLAKQNADVHVLKAAHLVSRRCFAEALAEAELAARILRAASPMFYDVLLEYASLAEVSCSLVEAGQQRARSVFTFATARLRGLGRVFPIARPAALLAQGVRHWQAGRKRRAEAAWKAAEQASTTLAMPHFGALVRMRRELAQGGGEAKGELV